MRQGDNIVWNVSTFRHRSSYLDALCSYHVGASSAACFTATDFRKVTCGNELHARVLEGRVRTMESRGELLRSLNNLLSRPTGRNFSSQLRQQPRSTHSVASLTTCHHHILYS
jgi:hypothetical protein